MEERVMRSSYAEFYTSTLLIRRIGYVNQYKTSFFRAKKLKDQNREIRCGGGQMEIAGIQLPALPSRRSGTAFPATCNQRMMPRGNLLTDFEKGIALALAANNATERTIAARLGRTKTAVHNLLVRYHSKKSKKKTERPPSVTPTILRAMRRHASTGNYTARAIRDMFCSTVSVRRVQQLLSTAEYLEYRKMKRNPRMTFRHYEERRKWARDRVQWAGRWKRVIFSDEKKFNLDGPDGFAYYWHDLRKEERYFSKRQNGGGGIMIWAAMSYRGLSDLYVVDGTLNSERYCNILSHYLLPFA